MVWFSPKKVASVESLLNHPDDVFWCGPREAEAVGYFLQKMTSELQNQKNNRGGEMPFSEAFLGLLGPQGIIKGLMDLQVGTAWEDRPVSPSPELATLMLWVSIFSIRGRFSKPTINPDFWIDRGANWDILPPDLFKETLVNSKPFSKRVENLPRAPRALVFNTIRTDAKKLMRGLVVSLVGSKGWKCFVLKNQHDFGGAWVNRQHLNADRFRLCERLFEKSSVLKR